MRLKRITIKNFRSISELENFDFVDLGITCFIGGNGTGKSNILRAISYLEEEGPSDEDFYAKSEDSDDCGLIKAEFVFEDKDSELLESNGLLLKDIGGFYANVEKERGEDSTIEFGPLLYKGDTRDINAVIKGIAKDIMFLTEGLEQTPEIRPIIEMILVSLQSGITLDVPEHEQNMVKISEAAEQLITINSQEVSQEILKKIDEIKKISRPDLNDTLHEIFNNLSIEFLTFDAYEIENKAPRSELNDNSKHPFLYDLLLLSNKSASDFSVPGVRLQRKKEAASKLISESISKVWGTHKLDFVVDCQGDDIIFTVYTPQRQQIDLTSLSDGEKWFLKFYTRLAIAQHESKQVLWMFDEPGRDLHSSSQIDLKRFFEEISKTSQVIYTTHQPMMVPWHRLERIFVVENLKRDGTVVHKRFWKDTGLESPLKEALSTFVGEELFTGKRHIIVEGISDYFYLQGWLLFFQRNSSAKIWRETFETSETTTLPVDGIAKIPLYCWFLGRQIKSKVNWVAIVDSKNEEETTRNMLETTGLGSWKKNAVCIGDLTKMKDAESIEEIENIFKPEEYIGVFHEYYKEEHPNLNMPTNAGIRDRLSKNKKITKVITDLLQKKNPGLEINGKPIELDKTGIARKVYLILTREKELPFSKETQSNFENVLRNASKMLPKEKSK